LKHKKLPCKKGVTSISALFFLLIVFTILGGLFKAYFDYNLALQDQKKIETERIKEKIALTGLDLDQEDIHVSNITIKNVGTIDANIRAIYIANSTKTTLICDPSRDPGADTHIPPGESRTIPLPGGIPFDSEARITAATERGIKSTEYEALLYFGSSKPPTAYDHSLLYIGPLVLKFDGFWYREIPGDGNWYPGWEVPKGIVCAWNLTIKNIDPKNRSITINRFSCFTTVKIEGSNVRNWYLNSTNENRTQFLELGQEYNIIYFWRTPYTEQTQTIYTQESNCMVFLTFFGTFHDEEKTPYAQTIPFEAAITII